MKEHFFWLSWVHFEHMGPFELHSPWWISGVHADGGESICAAVQARDEEFAKWSVERAYDNPPEERAALSWRFCKPRPRNWMPFTDRFPRAPWMKWPMDEFWV